MLRKEHKKKYQTEKNEDDRMERKNFRKNKSRERARSEDYAEPDSYVEDE